jgi:hypothetical protein
MDIRALRMLGRSAALAGPFISSHPSVHTVCAHSVLGRFDCARAYNI